MNKKALRSAIFENGLSIFLLIMLILCIGNYDRCSFEYETLQERLDTKNQEYNQLFENYSNIPFDTKHPLYNDTLEGDLVHEQRVSCYQGCHQTARLMRASGYISTACDELWAQCIEFCECLYNVTYDENGDIASYRYCMDCDKLYLGVQSATVQFVDIKLKNHLTVDISYKLFLYLCEYYTLITEDAVFNLTCNSLHFPSGIPMYETFDITYRYIKSPVDGSIVMSIESINESAMNCDPQGG